MERVGKTALVFGTTGAVGKELLHLLLQDHRYDKILAFTRRVIPIEHPRLEIVLDALTNLDALAGQIKGDELYCCLGTTRRKAGSREAFRRVDLEMPASLAGIAFQNKVDGFIAISSVGAGKSGRGFYLDVKSAMEDKLIQYSFPRLAIVRPSLLLAKRDEFRISEESGKILNTLTSWAMVGKMARFKGIQAETVARAMISIMNMEKPKVFWESEELQSIAGN